jgi:prophage maintenance system killer protein
LNSTELVEKLKEFFLNPDYTCLISREFKEGAASVDVLLEAIIKDFNEAIIKASGVDEKINIIAKCVQHIDQLHPFGDGNLRTSYVLLNALLRKNELSLCLLLNPNRIDCSSHIQVVEMIKLGQKNYHQFIDHINTKPKAQLIFKTPSEPLQILQTIHLAMEKIHLIGFRKMVN